MNHLGTAIVVALLAAGLAWPAAAQGSKAMLKDKNGKDVGVVELMQTPAGVLLKDRSTAAIIAGVRRLFAGLPDRAATRAYAEHFSWDATTNGQLDLFERIMGCR